jgi:hypothetical protein
MMNLIPGYDEGFGKKQFLIVLFTFLGAVTTLITLFFTRDLLISGTVWLAWLGLLCWIWEKTEGFKWEFYLIKDLIDVKAKLLSAAI